MRIVESESGAIINLGRHFSLCISVTVDAEGELESTWSDLALRLSNWRARRADRAREVTIWYKLSDELAAAGKCLLAQHLLCQDEPALNGIKVCAFVVGPDHRFHCEIGIPALI